MKIGQAIKQTRKMQLMKQKGLAGMVGITQAYLSGVETGKKNASTDVLEQIANALNIPLPVLYWRSLELNDIPENKRKLFKLLIPSVNGLIDSMFD